MGEEPKKTPTSKAHKSRSEDIQPEYDFDYTKAKPNRFVGKIAKEGTNNSKLKLLTSRLILFGVLILWAAPVFAQDDSSRIRNLSTERAYQELLHAKIFNLGGYGWGLEITPEEEAFRKLLESRNPFGLFKQLLGEANPEGQLYALYGLYLEDRNLFAEEAEKLKNDDGPPARWEGLISIEKGRIRFGRGCILSRKNRQVLIEQMAHGDFDEAFKALSATLKH